MTYKELGIYIHIPFCKQKCYYCDFISYANKNDIVELYIKKVIEEIKEYDFSKYKVTTIYIGGGTPSYIDSFYIKNILEALKEKLKENTVNFNDIEITIEINPGTLTESKIKEYKEAGVNRVSLGLQTTNNKLLKQIGRIHLYEDFLKSYKIVQKEISNINIDLIIGIPNQTIENIKESIEEVIKLEPKHISVYSLIIEEGTTIEKMLEKKELELPEEELERQMYWYVKNKLELNGYEHYEISNFAKEGYKSKHNTNCWEQKEYVGIGVAAHSYVDGVRYSNTEQIEKYIKGAQKIIHEKQTIEDMKKEYMLLGLRKTEGVQISKFKEKFGENPIYIFRTELNKLVEEKLLAIDGDAIKLTNKGLDLANIVWEEFV